MSWHGYILLENLSLNNTQRSLLVDGLKTLGPSSSPQPAELNHWRIRLDNDAVIFEAKFNTNNISISAIKNRLGNIFGIDPGDINHATIPGDDTVIAFSYLAIDRIRFTVFGTLSALWNESGDRARGYLLANITEWEIST